MYLNDSYLEAPVPVLLKYLNLVLLQDCVCVFVSWHSRCLNSLFPSLLCSKHWNICNILSANICALLLIWKAWWFCYGVEWPFLHWSPFVHKPINGSICGFFKSHYQVADNLILPVTVCTGTSAVFKHFLKMC